MLPGVLACDQPDTAPQVAETLRRIPVANLRRPVAVLSSREAPADARGEVRTRSALSVLKASASKAGARLHEGLRRPSAGGAAPEALEDLEHDAAIAELRSRLEDHPVTKLQPVPAAPPTRVDAAIAQLTKHFGVTEVHLRIGAQTATSFLIIMVLTVVEPVYHALYTRTSECDSVIHF